ncbi:MAG: hypothetical protein ACJAWV_002149 [Flammeovirgaceae bacterium]|jgi:hypothetical protein
MDNKTQIHEELMEFLDDYLKNTPKNIIENDINQISSRKFEGATAEDYFKNFHENYQNIAIQTYNDFSLENHKEKVITRLSTKIFSYFSFADREMSPLLSGTEMKSIPKSNIYNLFETADLVSNIQKRSYESV